MCRKCNGTGNLNEHLGYGVLVKACPDCLPSAEEQEAQQAALRKKWEEAAERLGMEKPNWDLPWWVNQYEEYSRKDSCNGYKQSI